MPKSEGGKKKSVSGPSSETKRASASDKKKVSFDTAKGGQRKGPVGSAVGAKAKWNVAATRARRKKSSKWFNLVVESMKDDRRLEKVLQKKRQEARAKAKAQWRSAAAHLRLVNAARTQASAKWMETLLAAAKQQEGQKSVGAKRLDTKKIAGALKTAGVETMLGTDQQGDETKPEGDKGVDFTKKTHENFVTGKKDEKQVGSSEKPATPIGQKTGTTEPSKPGGPGKAVVGSKDEKPATPIGQRTDTTGPSKLGRPEKPITSREDEKPGTTAEPKRDTTGPSKLGRPEKPIASREDEKPGTTAEPKRDTTGPSKLGRAEKPIASREDEKPGTTAEPKRDTTGPSKLGRPEKPIASREDEKPGTTAEPKRDTTGPSKLGRPEKPIASREDEKPGTTMEPKRDTTGPSKLGRPEKPIASREDEKPGTTTEPKRDTTGPSRLGRPEKPIASREDEKPGTTTGPKRDTTGPSKLGRPEMPITSSEDEKAGTTTGPKRDTTGPSRLGRPEMPIASSEDEKAGTNTGPKRDTTGPSRLGRPEKPIASSEDEKAGTTTGPKRDTTGPSKLGRPEMPITSSEDEKAGTTTGPKRDTTGPSRLGRPEMPITSSEDEKAGTTTGPKRDTTGPSRLGRPEMPIASSEDEKAGTTTGPKRDTTGPSRLGRPEKPIASSEDEKAGTTTGPKRDTTGPSKLGRPEMPIASSEDEKAGTTTGLKRDTTGPSKLGRPEMPIASSEDEKARTTTGPKRDTTGPSRLGRPEKPIASSEDEKGGTTTGPKRDTTGPSKVDRPGRPATTIKEEKHITGTGRKRDLSGKKEPVDSEVITDNGLDGRRFEAKRGSKGTSQMESSEMSCTKHVVRTSQEHGEKRGFPKMNITSTEQICHLVHTGAYLMGLQEETRYCDVLLGVGDCLFASHSIILSCYSGLFKRIIPDLKQKDKTTYFLKLMNISSEGVRVFISYAYSGILEISEDNIGDALHAATLLEVPTMQKECLNYTGSIDPGQGLKLLLCRTGFENYAIFQRAIQCIVTNFYEVGKDPLFYKLDVESVCWILSNDYLLVSSELDVFCAAQKWLLADLSNRCDHVELIIDCIRFARMSDTDLLNVVVLSEPLGRENVELIKEKVFHACWANPILFGKTEAEMALKDSEPGTYLLYRDYETDHLYLSIRAEEALRHHRIIHMDSLFYLDKQPYPYLDSIILYHRKYKLRGIRLTRQAPLSARVVKLFATKFATNNGNLPSVTKFATNNGNLPSDTQVALEEAVSRL